LWKILRGDGNDVSICFWSFSYQSLNSRLLLPHQIGPYSPSTLCRTSLPPKLRAANLVLDDELYNSISDMQVFFSLRLEVELTSNSETTQLILIFKNAGDRPPPILTKLLLLTVTIMSMSGVT
jgi:hypothetical protein